MPYLFFVKTLLLFYFLKKYIVNYLISENFSYIQNSNLYHIVFVGLIYLF